MPGKIPKVSIVILHFKNTQLLEECLDSCDKLSYLNYEIIIVLNGNNSRTIQGGLKKHRSSIQMISLPSNVGYSRGNNLGIQKALKNHADYVLLLNDDAITTADFLNILVEEAEKSSDTAMVGPVIYYADPSDKIWFDGADFDRNECKVYTKDVSTHKGIAELDPHETDYVTGCALLIKRNVLETIGLLDERFFLYWEDVDLGLRAKRAGLKNIIVPKARIYHKVSVSIGGTDSALKAYHKTRSNLLLAKLHAPKAIKKLIISFLRDITWLIFKSSDEKRFFKASAYLAAIIDFYRRKANKGPDWIWGN